jgi:hypothetical protein
MLGLLGWVLCNNVQAACRAPALIAPAQAEISVASPRFEWSSVSDVRHYLVWLESRVPEGRVLLSEEFQTSATYLIPPRPLTADKATVRLRVTAVCKDDTQAVVSARFRIDADRACSLKTPPVAEQKNGLWNLRWETLSSAQRYEIRVHAADDGKPVFTYESKGTSTKIDRLEPGEWLFAVQPVCKGLKGVTRWVSVETLLAKTH